MQRYQRCSHGYRDTVFRLSHLVKNNYIKIPARIGRTWIDNANYFRPIPVPGILIPLIPLKLQPRYVTSEMKNKKNTQEDREENTSLKTILFRQCFWKRCATKSGTTLLLNNISCLSLPVARKWRLPRQNIFRRRHSIFSPLLPFSFELPQSSEFFAFPSWNI